MKAKVNNLTILHITILHKFKMSARLQKNVTGKTNRGVLENWFRSKLHNSKMAAFFAYSAK